MRGAGCGTFAGGKLHVVGWYLACSGVHMACNRVQAPVWSIDARSLHHTRLRTPSPDSSISSTYNVDSCTRSRIVRTISEICFGFQLVTAQNAFSRIRDYSGKAECHSLAKKDFASIQRDLLTLLIAASPFEIRMRLPTCRERFDAAVEGSPALDTRKLIDERDEDGFLIFSFIPDQRLLQEVTD